jgi:hypothetical protein
LENLEKIGHAESPDPGTLPVDSKKCKYVTSSVGKSSKNPKASNMWYHHFDKHNFNTDDCRAIYEFKRKKMACFDIKSGPGKKSLAFHLEEINRLKRQRLQATRRGKLNPSSLQKLI